MIWVDRILDFIHVMWFEITHFAGNIWIRVRPLFWVYLIIVLAVIAFAVLCGIVILGGVLTNSNWVIFWGGLVLLGVTAVLGVILIPMVLGFNIIRAIARLIGVKI